MKHFLFGAVYIIEQDYKPGEIERDLKWMRSDGYNLITLWPVTNAWLANHPHEWVFSKTKEVLDICENLGMKAILQLFGQNQAQEFMPDSVLTDDMMVRDERGDHINENCFWANLNHPIVREYIDLYFQNAIEALKNHPAVYGWDVFNEAHFRSDDEYTIRKYQTWLEQKYQTIENLNFKWYRRYETFSQISPRLRRSPYSIWSSILPDIEYERFRSENLTEICRFLFDTAKKYDSQHPIIIDGTSSQILAEDVTMRNNDEIATAKIPDIYGATFYPKSWGRNYRETPWTMSMYYALPAGMARKAGKPYLVNELQTHTQSVLTPGSEVTAQELYNWMLMCIFTGASGLQLWRWRPFLHGYQSTGRGLTQMDGTPNHRAKRVKELVGFLHENTDLFVGAEIRKPDVKIAVSYGTRLFFDALLKWNQSFWKDDVEGWYKLFWNRGILPEFADLEDLEGEDAKVIVLPAVLSINKTVAAQLKKYVSSGGLLIADARMGAMNEFGEVPPEGIPGKEMSELFGFIEKDVDSGQFFKLGNNKIPCNYMNQVLEVEKDTEILAVMEDGSPAVTYHSFGKGGALYFNSFAGVEYKEKSHSEIEELVMKYCLNQGDGIFTVEKGEKVHIAYLEKDAAQLVLLINFDTCSQTVTFNQMRSGTVFVNLMTGKQIRIDGNTKINIPENSADVYWYEKTFDVQTSS